MLEVTAVCNFSVADTIVGPKNSCKYTGAGSNAIYSIDASDVSGYAWTVTSITGPSGYTITGGLTGSSIEVHFNPGFVSATIKVVVTSNCNVQTIRTISVSNTAPVLGGVISGPVNACPFIGTNLPVTYSIAAIENALSYSWTLPPFVTMVSGQGTNSVQVKFLAGYSAAQIKVFEYNNIGTGSSL
jgi:hypothetical protein